MRKLLETKAAALLDAMDDEQLFTFIMERAKGHAPIVNGPTEPPRRLPSKVAKGDDEQPTRRTRRAFPTKLYRPLLVKRGRYAGQPVEPQTELPNGYKATYKAVLDAWRKGPSKGKGITSREIIERTGDKPKQVESALWFLRRQAECIESVENGQ
jgi:hypothetical protein